MTACCPPNAVYISHNKPWEEKCFLVKYFIKLFSVKVFVSRFVQWALVQACCHIQGSNNCAISPRQHVVICYAPSVCAECTL